MAGDISPAQRATVQSGRSRVAFYGRCGSVWEAPVSLLRQIYAAETALSIPIATCFADIGVWNHRRPGTPRVTSLAGHRVHGGLVELIKQAHERHRGFDIVVCTDESRLPRRAHEHQAVLLEMTECGVRVVTLSSMIPPDFPGPTASTPPPWSSGLSDWATQTRNPIRRLTDGPTAIEGVEAR